MELHELNAAWAALGQRMDVRDQQIADLRQRGALLGMQSRLRLVTRGQVVQLLVGLVFAVWGGSAWVDHWGIAHVVAYGLGVHAYGVALLATAAVQLVRITAIDYSGPVAAVQRDVLRLKRARVKSERFLLAIGGVGWVPVMFLLAYHAGLDIWPSRPAHVLANLAVGAAIACALLWASVRYPAWLERTAQGKDLVDMERDLDDLGA